MAFGVQVPEVKKKEAQAICLFEENMEAFQVFTSMTTQWNIGGLGVVTGLNYNALVAVMTLMKIEDLSDCFARIRIMESETLRLISEKREKNGS